MPIQGLSNQRRLSRDGKVKLGKKQKNSRGVEYPTQTKYFVVPEEVQKIYGPEPTELDIMFPSENLELVFPQYYKCYGTVGLKCKGDGEKAIMMTRGQMIEKTCTPGDDECKKAGCKPVATLKVLLPKVPGFGVWDFNTSSWNSIVNINTCIDTIKLLTGGRIAFIPLKLKYGPHTGRIYDSKNDKEFTKEVYVMSITIDETMEGFYKKFRLPDPSEYPQLAGLIDANRKMKALLESKNNTIQIDENEEFQDADKDEGQRCNDCDSEITPTDKMNIEELINYSRDNFGRPLCSDCMKEILKFTKAIHINKSAIQKVDAQFTDEKYREDLERLYSVDSSEKLTVEQAKDYIQRQSSAIAQLKK
jgi:hypothetical protein